MVRSPHEVHRLLAYALEQRRRRMEAEMPLTMIPLRLCVECFASLNAYCQSGMMLFGIPIELQANRMVCDMEWY